MSGRGLAAVAARLARQAASSRRLALREAGNKVLLGHTALRLRRFEDVEVSRLAASARQLPAARVATVIATYRRPELLRGAVRSVLAQSASDQVVIVVDDGGGLADLPADPRLLAVSLSANTAVAGVVRNVGIRLTRSEYVAFLDDDNEWEPQHLEVALAALESGRPGERPDVVYTAMRRCLPDGRQHDVLSDPFDRRRLARDSYLDTNPLVIRRSAGLHFSRIRRPPSVRPREDWELVYRLSRRLAVRHVPVPTVMYRISPDSHWSDWARLDRPARPASRPLDET